MLKNHVPPDKNFIVINMYLFSDTNLSLSEIAVYSLLKRFQELDIQPTRGQISDDLNLTERTVRTVFNRLEEEGFIKIIRTKSNRKNTYKLLK